MNCLRLAFLLTFSLSFNYKVFGQIVFNLSGRHAQRINNTVSPEKKLRLYRKYYKIDSLRFEKRIRRYWQKEIDDITHASVKRQRAAKSILENPDDGPSSRIYVTIYIPWARRQAMLHVSWLDQHSISTSAINRQVLINYFEWYYLRVSQNDSMLTVIKQRCPNIDLPKRLSQKVRRYIAIYGKTTSSDSPSILDKEEGLQGIALGLDNPYSDKIANVSQYTNRGSIADAGRKLMTQQTSNLKSIENIENNNQQLEQVEELKGQATRSQQQINQLQDSTYIKEQVKKKAEEQAMRYVADHPEVMQGVQRKMGLLMKKYSLVPNSNDLSSAVKRTSLSGKSLQQRLYLASNLQVISLNPVSIDFSPVVGYRFNTGFIAGIGGTYRQTFSDTIPVVAPVVFGYKLFTSYDVLNNFFAYGEIDRNSPGVEKNENESKRIWKNAAFLGVGRKFMVSARVEMTVVMMYNFLHENFDPVYPKAWVVRVGFQGSQLAFLKK
jgi:hypothetical protein